MTIRKTNLLVIILIIALFNGACSGLNRSDKPPIRTWWLEPYTENVIPSSSGKPVQITVQLSVVPGLDTHRILTLSNNAELNRYSGARWADSLPELLSSLVSRSLEASGDFEIVPGRASAGECELDLEVQKFYARLDAKGQTSDVMVTLAGQYRCDDSEPVLIRLEKSESVREERMSVIVAAFQTALDDVMRSLLSEI